MRPFLTPLRRAASIALLATTLAGSAAAARPVDAPAQVAGSWVNPHGSVTVKTGPCADGLCGWVSRATPQAQQDAHDAGIANLVGTELLQNYRRTGATRWTGRVYVPDMGGTYYSTIQQIDADRLKISGCILGGLVCKSQIWRRG
ncbi:hypothetical protein BH10PSE12_BH10PSE12_19570 [soil metagenome]